MYDLLERIHTPASIDSIIGSLVLLPLHANVDGLYLRGDVEFFSKPYKLHGDLYCMEVVEVAAWGPCSRAMQVFAESFGAKECNWYACEPGNGVYEKHDESGVFDDIECVVSWSDGEETFPSRKDAEEFVEILKHEHTAMEYEPDIIDVDEI